MQGAEKKAISALEKSKSKLRIELTEEWRKYTSIVPEGYEVLGVVYRNNEPGALCYYPKKNRYVRVNHGFITAHLNGYSVSGMLAPRKRFVECHVDLKMDSATHAKAKLISPKGNISEGIRMAIQAYQIP